MDYRIEKLITSLKYERIVVYGTGINAERVVDALSDRNIIGILDGNINFGYFDGIKILTIEEMLLQQPEAVIIAAQHSSTLSIYNRICKTCMEHHIKLLDMSGNDLFDLVDNIEKQKDCFEKNIEEIKREIDQHEVISFDIFDTLIMRNTLFPEDVFYIVESKVRNRGIALCDLRNRRALAEQSIDCISPNIYQIYDAYQKREGFTSTIKRILLDYELSVEKAVLIRREDIVQVMNYAVSNNKPVYLISDMYLPKELIEVILSELGIVGYRDILVSCDYHQTKYTGLYHTFMDLYPAESYLHIGDNAVADGFCAKSNGMDVYIIQSALALLEKSSYGFMLKKQLSLNERSMLGLLIAKIFNSPFSLYGSDRRPYVDSIKDISYLYFAPVILKVMLWLMDKLLEGDYEKVLFSARDGFLIQELYDYMRLTRNGLPDSVYFQASRVLCARAGLSSDADIEGMLSAPFDCSWKEVVKERFDLNDNDMLDEHNSEYNSVLDYAMSHKDKIYKRSREIRQNYNKYMKLLGIKEGRTYAFYDFVSCGTCQYFLSNFVSFDLQGLYCGYYDSVTGGKRNVPIEALFVNQNYFQKETAFFKRYLLFERIMTSTASSVISMDTCGKPLFSEESRSLHELDMVKIAQESIKDYIKKYIDSLYVDGSSIDVMFVDALFALFSLKYTNENCEEFEQILLVDDFGKNVLKITREELQ